MSWNVQVGNALSQVRPSPLVSVSGPDAPAPPSPPPVPPPLPPPATATASASTGKATVAGAHDDRLTTREHPQVDEVDSARSRVPHPRLHAGRGSRPRSSTGPSPAPPRIRSRPLPPNRRSRPPRPCMRSAPDPPPKTSLPGPPTRVSWPAPESSRSLPADPVSRSACGPPSSSSRPAPPVRRSLPCPPMILSAPPRPDARSFPAPRKILSARFVPEMLFRPADPLKTDGRRRSGDRAEDGRGRDHRLRHLVCPLARHFASMRFLARATMDRCAPSLALGPLHARSSGETKRGLDA